MKRRLAVVLACGLIGLLTLAAPTAQAERSGALTVEVEATFGSPLPSGLAPFTGEAEFSGVADASQIPVTGLFRLEPDGSNSVHFFAGLQDDPFFTDVPGEGGRFAVRIEFPVVFCPRCPAR